MLAFNLLTVSFPLLATASPLVAERAGGPVAKPIPSTCTVINPLPHAACGTANVDGYKPNPTFVNLSLLYSSYFESFLPVETQAQQCRQQCYGYGASGDCVSSFVAYNVPVPVGYMGSEGGQLETACLLFSDYLTPVQFIQGAEGQYVNGTAASIYCPA